MISSSTSSVIVGVAEMRAWEARTWAVGVDPRSVIQRAGEGVARVLESVSAPGCPVLVVAGGGHNGDDASVAGEAVRDRRVTCHRVDGAGGWEGVRRWLGEHAGNPQAWVVDGLFGIGLNRPITGAAAAGVEALNAARLRVLAVDVPSGLDADTGVASGPVIRADLTVTLGAVKRGLLRESAAEVVGRIECVEDIGLVGAKPDGEVFWTRGRDFDGFPPVRPVGGHKGTFGHLGIVAGTTGYHGAAVLAAQGAARARPGLVTLFTDDRCYLPVAAQLRSAMVRPWTGERLEVEAFSAWVIGPGLAARDWRGECRVEVDRIWREASCPVVADASVLAGLPARVSAGAGLRVVTPHPGEAARMLGCTVGEVQSDRGEAAGRLAARLGDGGREPVVVLKGRHTVIRDGRGRLYVNASGNPGMAQGGTGDVLAGYLGGWLAQPRLGSDAVRAIRYAVWRHGAVADRLEAAGRAWTPEDLVMGMGDGG